MLPFLRYDVQVSKSKLRPQVGFPLLGHSHHVGQSSFVFSVSRTPKSRESVYLTCHARTYFFTSCLCLTLYTLLPSGPGCRTDLAAPTLPHIPSTLLTSAADGLISIFTNFTLPSCVFVTLIRVPVGRLTMNVLPLIPNLVPGVNSPFLNR
ncbi:hypothetical protein NP493_1225g01002 [Ridgeia piscesae]|uniref:Uncharacterized protein n=1 Tax=Ridgeia piscesae TaxID=27915 RepID=A0AAD9NHG2_RIDPI|nr:hypothetical protein NP493_1225g01002 [Ridgeia piscesae]